MRFGLVADALCARTISLTWCHSNATLAAGVAVGSSSDLVISLGGVGRRCCSRSMVRARIRLHSAFPGDAWASTIRAASTTCMACRNHRGCGRRHFCNGCWRESLWIECWDRFPRRSPIPANATDAEKLRFGLSAADQMGVQVAALFITLAISIVGGIITGLIVEAPCLLPPGKKASWQTWRVPLSYWYQTTITGKCPRRMTTTARTCALPSSISTASTSC